MVANSVLSEVFGHLGSTFVNRVCFVADYSGNGTIEFDEFVCLKYILDLGTLDDRLQCKALRQFLR